MATNLGIRHRRSRPRIKRIEGRWDVLSDAFTHPALFEKAEEQCALLNSPIRLFRMRGGKFG